MSEMIEMKTMTVLGQQFEIVDEKARTKKVNLPVDYAGNVVNGNSGQILQTNGDGTTAWVNKPTGGGSGGSVDIDATLTASGQAADAKVVGDKFTEISETIDDISEQINIQKEILQPTSELQFNRNFRVLKERYKYGTDEYKANTETNAYKLQSMTCCNGDVILGYVNNDNTVGTLEERKYDGTLVKSVTFENGELGHANGMTSYNGKIYVATLDKIAVIDYNSFAYEGTIDFGVTLNSIAYDKTKNKWYGLKNKALYSLDLATRESTLLYNLEDLGGVYQSICVDNDVVYVSVAKPNLIIIFHKGKRVVSYNIARYFGYDYFGETQDIEIVDGTMYITSQWVMHCDNYWHDTLWNVDLNNNYVFKPRYSDNFVNTFSTIYCDSSSEDVTPNGLQGKPFKTLSECINVLISPLARSQSITNISLKGNFNEHLYVKGVEFRLIGNSATRPNILCGAELETAKMYCSNVYFTNQDKEIDSTMYVQNTTLNTNASPFDTLLDSQENLIKASYSDLKLHGDCLKNKTKVTNPILNYYSKVMGEAKSVIDSVVYSKTLYES